MNRFLQITFVTILGVVFSCQKVIDVPVNEADQKIVVEGVLKNFQGESYVKLSKTGSVYANTEFEKISNASVVVTDGAGVPHVFIEDSVGSGRYTLSTFSALENMAYSLRVETTEGEVLEAYSTSRSLPVIDSITFMNQTFGGNSFYLPTYHSVDNGSEQNHYRLRIWVNSKETEFYYLGDDQFINGKYYAAQFFGTSADLNDTIFIEMWEMDKRVYDYFYGLSNESDNSTFAPAPANPATNIEGDGIGFFGVFMTDTMSTIVD